MTEVVIVNIYTSLEIYFRRIIMTVTKEIKSIFSKKESVINILSSLLLSNSSFMNELQVTAKNIANHQNEVANDK